MLLKAQAVKETLEHLGHLVLPHDPELITGEPWHYRLRTQVHTEVDPVAGGVRVGYHARGTNEVIPVSRCPLLVPELEALLAELPRPPGRPGAPQRLDLAAGDGGAVTVSARRAGPAARRGVDQSGTSPTPTTPAASSRPTAACCRGWWRSRRRPGKGRRRSISTPGSACSASRSRAATRQVIAVEGDQIGSRFARLNVKRNRVTNVEVRQPGRRELGARPAGGAGPRDRRPAPRRPRRATCARPAAAPPDAPDVRLLPPRRPGPRPAPARDVYRIEHLVFVDLFPQTGHMEVIVQLVAIEPPAV